jgi:hypothetical protein
MINQNLLLSYFGILLLGSRQVITNYYLAKHIILFWIVKIFFVAIFEKIVFFSEKGNSLKHLNILKCLVVLISIFAFLLIVFNININFRFSISVLQHSSLRRRSYQCARENRNEISFFHFFPFSRQNNLKVGRVKKVSRN